MSNLAAAFMRRQPQRRDSASTISSQAAEDIIRHQQQTTRETDSRSNSRLPPVLFNCILNSCSDIRFGENASNDFPSYLTKDSGNPVFVLKDKNISWRKKARFILGQQWCWGVLLLLMLTVGFAIMLMMVLAAKTLSELVNNRDVWGALPPDKEFPPLNLPVFRVIVTHTVGQNCTTKMECINRIKILQLDYYNDLGDIPYNFLIGGDGSLFEGRGFRFQGQIPGNHSASFNNLGLIVAFIGTFIGNLPSSLQLQVFDAFLQQSIKRDLMNQNYRLLLADQLVLSEPAASGLQKMLANRADFYQMQKIYSRAEWGAVDAWNRTEMANPVGHVLLLAEPKFACDSLENCLGNMSLAQNSSVDFGYSDIEYNFVVSSFGIFEGRGWDSAPGAYEINNMTFLSKVSIKSEVKFWLTVGVFPTTFQSETQYEALNATAARLLTDAIFIGKLARDFTLVCDLIYCNGFQEPTISTTLEQTSESQTTDDQTTSDPTTGEPTTAEPERTSESQTTGIV